MYLSFVCACVFVCLYHVSVMEQSQSFRSVCSDVFLFFWSGLSMYTYIYCVFVLCVCDGNVIVSCSVCMNSIFVSVLPIFFSGCA